MPIFFVVSTTLFVWCALDIDECAEGTAVCAAKARCVNKEGGYSCQCIPGLVGNGKVLCQGKIRSFNRFLLWKLKYSEDR